MLGTSNQSAPTTELAWNTSANVQELWSRTQCTVLEMRLLYCSLPLLLPNLLRTIQQLRHRMLAQFLRRRRDSQCVQQGGK